MATKKLVIGNKKTVNAMQTKILPRAIITSMGKRQHAAEIAHDGSMTAMYAADALILTKGLAQGRNDVAVREFAARKEAHKIACYPKECKGFKLGTPEYTTAWNSSKEYQGMKRAIKALVDTGLFTAPTAEKEPTSESEKKKQANKVAAEKSRAKKAIIAAKPSRKFKDGELDELVKERVKEVHAAQTATGREITRLAAWCKKVSALSLELPEIATANVSEIQLRMAAVIAAVVAITPKAN